MIRKKIQRKEAGNVTCEVSVSAVHRGWRPKNRALRLFLKSAAFREAIFTTRDDEEYSARETKDELVLKGQACRLTHPG